MPPAEEPRATNWRYRLPADLQFDKAGFTVIHGNGAPSPTQGDGAQSMRRWLGNKPELKEQASAVVGQRYPPGAAFRQDGFGQEI
jgi:hypothetical protein